MIATPARLLGRTLALSALLLSPAFAQTTLYWDGDGTGAVAGGTGTWSTGLARWSTIVNGASYQVWNNAANNDAVFQNTAGTVTLGTDVTARSLTFNTTGYLLAGTGTLTLAGGTGSINTGSGTQTISANILGSTGLTKSGSGTLILSGTNAYTGGTTLSAGTLSISSDANLGDASGSLTFTGGNLTATAAFSSARPLALNAATRIDTGAHNIVLSGALTGSGAVTKNGSGTLTLSANNITSRALALNAGTIEVSGAWHDVTLGSSTTLRANGDITILRSSNISPLALTNIGNITIDSNGHHISVGPSFGGTNNASLSLNGTLTKTGAGTLTLTNGLGPSGLGSATAVISQGTLAVTAPLGNATYRLDGGTLRANAALSLTVASTANGGTFDTGGFDQALPNFTSNGTVAKIGDGNLTVTNSAAGILSFGGAGALAKTGSGTLTLTGNNTYAGGTTVTGGLIQFSSADNFGTGHITLNGGGLQWATGTSTDISSRLNALGSSGATFDTNGGNVTLATAFTGTGAITKTGAGTLTLSANSITPRVFTLNHGTIAVSGLWRDVALASGTTLRANGDITITGPNPSPVTVSGNPAAITIDTNGHNITVGPSFGGAGNASVSINGTLTKIGLGTLTLTNGVGASGGGGGSAVISEGTLAVMTPLGFNGRYILDGGTFQANAGLSIDLSSTANGGTLDTGGFNIVLSSFGTQATVAKINDGNLTVTNTLAAAITFGGAGALAKSGSGTLTLSGDNTYAGGTTVTGGLIQFSSAGNFGTGAITLSGGGLRWDATTADLSARLTLGSSGATFDTNGNDVTFATALGGTGGLIKTGPGTLSLSAPNTSARDLTLTGGTLELSGAWQNIVSANTVTLRALGDLALTRTTASSPITGSGNLTLDTGAHTVSVASGNSSVSLGFTGNVTKTGSGTLALAGGSSAATTVSEGTLTLGATTAGGSYTLAGTTLRATGNLTALPLTTTAAGGTVDSNGFDLTLSGATTLAGNVTKTGSGTLALSSQTISGNLTVAAGTLQLGANPSGTIINHANVALNGTFTFSATQSGTGNLVKTGSNTVTVTGAQTHSGATSLTGGTLALGASDLLPDATALTLSGGTLALGSFNETVGAVVLQSGSLTSTTGTLTGSSYAAESGTISAILAGSGALSKSTSGTLILSGASTFTGGTTVSGGTIQFSSAANFGTGNLTLDGGALRWATGTTTDISSRLAALGAGGATFDTNGSNVTFSTALTGAGPLAKSGAGSLTLAAASTRTGTTTVAAGSLVLDHSLALQHSTVALEGGTLAFGTVTAATLGALTGSTNVPLTNGAAAPVALTLGNADASTYSGVFSGAGASLTKVGSGTVTLTASHTFTGNTTVEAGTLQLGNGGTTGTLASHVSISPGATFALHRSDALTLATVFGGSGAITKAGTANLTLTGDSPFTGTLALNGGHLQIGDGATSGSFAGNLSFATGTTLRFHRSDASTFAGALSGAGALVKLSPELLTLTGNNTFTGGTTLAAGTLAVGGSSALGSGPLALDGGGLRAAAGGGSLPNAASLNADTVISGTAALTLAGPLTLTGFKTLTIANTAQTTFSGPIGENSPSILIKQGAGELHLTGASSYTGGTFIQAGTVRINNSSGSAFGTGAVTIASGATLTGAGSFTGALQLNGIFSPGNSPGTTTTGSQTWAGGGTLVWEINNATGTAGTSWDLLSISGALAITATPASRFTLDVNSLTLGNTAGLAANFNPAQNYTFNVVTATGGISGFNTNAFTLDTSGFQNATQGGTWALSSSANTLALTFTAASAIPEPSTYAALAGLAALALAAFRRRRSAPSHSRP